MEGFKKIAILTHKDHRGWVSNLLDFLPIQTENLKNVHIVSMEPGEVRGNHFHNRQTEALCVLSGKIRVKAVNRSNGQTLEEVAGDDPPVMYLVSPGISHAFRNEDSSVGYLVCFTDTDFNFNSPDANADTLLEKE